MSIEARIEYVTTDDGVSLACTKFGSGPPVIYQFANPSSSHFEMELAWPPAVSTYQEFARIATVIRYGRNTGLSTRGVGDVSIEAHLRDLEAVRRHFQLEAMALMFPFTWARVAVAYAAAQPERVTALVLPHPMLFPETRYRGGVGDILRAAMNSGPELYATIRAVIWVGLEAHANAARLARYILESADFDDQMRCEKAIGQYDASAAASKVQAPTLIAHRKLPRYNTGPASAEMIRDHRARITRISAAIPGAQSAMFEGSSLWHSGDELITARSVDFLRQVFASQPAQAPEAATGAALGGTRTVLFTDLVGHTEMMSRLGDDRGRDVLREHERITREVLKANGGTEVKTMGDGFMASFGSVTKAVECAAALQRAFAGRKGEPLSVRVGLNAGEPIEEDGDLFGATVILASRIAAKADGGEILVSDTVRGLCSGKGFLFADRGDFVAKGFEEPVRVSEVSWRE